MMSLVEITNMHGYRVFVGRGLLEVRMPGSFREHWYDKSLVCVVHAGTNVDAIKRPRYGIPVHTVGEFGPEPIVVRKRQ